MDRLNWGAVASFVFLLGFWVLLGYVVGLWLTS